MQDVNVLSNFEEIPCQVLQPNSYIFEIMELEQLCIRGYQNGQYITNPALEGTKFSQDVPPKCKEGSNKKQK